jgi:hypothetical protein
VLSVVAQQILTIQRAIEMNAKEFMFEGKIILILTLVFRNESFIEGYLRSFHHYESRIRWSFRAPR